VFSDFYLDQAGRENAGQEDQPPAASDRCGAACSLRKRFEPTRHDPKHRAGDCADGARDLGNDAGRACSGAATGPDGDCAN
jgi:hypothetical protein